MKKALVLMLSLIMLTGVCHYPYRTDGDGNARVCYHCNPRYSSIGGNHNT